MKFIFLLKNGEHIYVFLDLIALTVCWNPNVSLKINVRKNRRDNKETLAMFSTQYEDKQNTQTQHRKLFVKLALHNITNIYWFGGPRLMVSILVSMSVHRCLRPGQDREYYIGICWCYALLAILTVRAKTHELLFQWSSTINM